MIVQRRHSEIRLITQHDHGLLSGELAAHWSTPGTGDRLSDVLVVTAELHDLAWKATDSQIVHWREDGLPADFMTYPEDEKLVLYHQGIEELAEIHPYAGLLMSHHYSAFASEERAPMFTTRERKRRKSLTEQCIQRGFDPSAVQEDFELLKVLDVLSLLVCVTPPGSREEDWPFWLNPSPLLQKRGITTSWQDDILLLDPYPFDAPIESVIPYRELPEDVDRSTTLYVDQLPHGLQTVQIAPS